MAAAAIRHAARRRIGGGALPRTVHPKRKPLVNSTATNKQQPPQGGQRGLTAEKKMEAAVRMALIDTKMEELYNHIAGFKTKYTLRGSEAQKHTSLMNELYEHVKPRPDDPLWPAGCEFFIVAAGGGSAFYLVKGALRSSSKGGRLAAGVQEVITNGPRVRRWAAWFGVMTAIHAGMVQWRQVYSPLNFVAAWGGANALFSVHQGPRAVVREGLKGAAYSALTGFTVGGLTVVLLQPPESNCC